MDEKKKTVQEEVQDTMACSAFAEAGEPCPIDKDQKEGEKEKDAGMSVKDTMACTAFAEAGEECPIGEEKKEDK